MKLTPRSLVVFGDDYTVLGFLCYLTVIPLAGFFCTERTSNVISHNATPS